MSYRSPGPAAIRAYGLSKAYTISRNKPSSMGEALVNGIRRPFSRCGRERFWALSDVSFEIEQGDICGVIGRNGAGKSTLLKLLSRITRPTAGRASICGRVGSLLEVGSGFHPELTGRENIFLNGAILGMSRREIASKFDAIVDFAEVERFLETPVKRYSSGMYVRLAFAVAAHLEPEVLIADEVLAVGDAAFQRKCLARMDEFARHGRTVVFVSHSMASVVSLCRSAVWLERGRVRDIGPARVLAPAYTADLIESSEALDERSAGSRARVCNVRALDGDGCERYTFDVFEAFAIEVTIEQALLPTPPRIVVRVRSATDGSEVLVTSDWDAETPIKRQAPGVYRVECRVPGNLLNCGSYLLSAGIDVPGGEVYSLVRDVKPLVIIRERLEGALAVAAPLGVLAPYREWRLTSVQEPRSAAMALSERV